MEPKKDVSTAILDQKKAPNKLLVNISVLFIGLISFEWLKFFSSIISSEDVRIKNF